MSLNTASPKMKKSFAPRSGPGRPRGKAPQQTGPHQGQPFDALYQNDRLVNSVTAVVGCTTRVSVKNGKTFEGIFKTISPEGSLVLDKAYQVDEQQQNGLVAPVLHQSTYEYFVVNRKDWVKVEFQDVDLEECCKKEIFKTDSDIAKKMNGQPSKPFKELKKWEPEVDGKKELQGLPIEGSRTMSNGWTPDEMFNTNADRYGVKSTFSEDMHEYTTKLEKSDTAEYKEKEKLAAQKAEEIINDSPYERGSLDSGRTDEALYSTVVQKNSPHNQRSNQTNWRDRPDQRPQKVPRDGSGSPAMTKKPEPAKNNQVDEAGKLQVKEKVVKPVVEPAVESKPETKVEASNDVSKENKQAPKANSVKPEIGALPKTTETPDTTTSVKPPDTVTSTNTTATVTTSSKELVEKEEVFKSLVEFSSNFKLSEKSEKDRKPKVARNVEKVSEEKKVEEQTEEITKEKGSEPQTSQDTKTEAESSAVKKLDSILNPNAKEFRPASSVKRSTPSPRSTSTPSSGGSSSPSLFQPQPPYGMPQYHQGGGGGIGYRPRFRGRPEYEHHNFVNASNAAGQPLFAQPMVPFVQQQSNVQFLQHGNIPHPAMQPAQAFFIPNVAGQGPVVVPINQLGAGPYHEPGQMYHYRAPGVQVLQSPPQMPSPSSQFTFPSTSITSPTVRPLSQLPQQAQQQQQQIVLQQPTQIITSNRPPPSNYQGN